ncbi:MAG: universal stress protein [Ilumatobacteraceae bacterium]|nr:universal stress protein [Ilumatobacteraceae bacterium]
MNGPIVVGTDGSPTAEVAVAMATTLASTFGQPLHIVSAYRPQQANGRGITAELATTITPHSWVESVLADAASRARIAGVDAVTHAQVGGAADALLEVAAQVNADLIVVGNRGIDSKSRFILGNVPSRVVHHAPCSTFVVKTDIE